MKTNTIRDELRKSYDSKALERDSYETEEWKIKERAGFIMLLQQEKKKRLLEIGAGPGHDSKFFQDHDLEVVCIDLSPAMVELCKQKGLTAFVMDMGNIEFPDNSFDAVYALNSLLHLTKEEFPKVLHRINSLLQAGGLFYLGVYGGYDHEGIWEEDSYIPKRFFSFFSDENLEQEISKVFNILTFNRIVFNASDPIHFQSFILKKRSP